VLSGACKGASFFAKLYGFVLLPVYRHFPSNVRERGCATAPEHAVAGKFNAIDHFGFISAEIFLFALIYV
jgi:Ni,Fe-hydrogenase III small subunit